eukprot:866162-Prymnesium_polylepis.1
MNKRFHHGVHVRCTLGGAAWNNTCGHVAFIHTSSKSHAGRTRVARGSHAGRTRVTWGHVGRHLRPQPDKGGRVIDEEGRTTARACATGREDP